MGPSGGLVLRECFGDRVRVDAADSQGVAVEVLAATMLAARLFPTPPLPCSERWTLPVALISIPSFGAKMRFLLSDQFLFVRRAAVVFEARPTGQTVA